MNKKFSTLLAGVALLSAVSANAAVENGKYYHLATGAASSEKVLTVGNADSLKMTADVPTKGLYAIDSALWKVSIETQPVTRDSVYTFENKMTGKLLALDLTKGAAKLSATGNAKWGVKNGNIYAAFTKNGKDSVAYIVSTGTPADTWKIETVKYGEAAPSGAVEFEFKKSVEEVVVTESDIDVLNSVNLTFSSNVEGNLFANPLIATSLKKQANSTGSQFAGADTLFLLQVKGQEVNADKVKQFISVDSVRFAMTAVPQDSLYGAKFMLDTLNTAKNPAMKDTALFAFKFIVNPTTNSVKVMLKKTYDFKSADGASFRSTVSELDSAYVTVSSLESTSVITTISENPKAITWGSIAGVPSIDTDIVYFIKTVSKGNITGAADGKYLSAKIACDQLLASNAGAMTAVAEPSLFLAQDQWYITHDGGANFTLTNRATLNVASTGKLVAIEGEDNTYSFNGAKIVLTEAEVDDATVGIRDFGKTALSNDAFYLSLNTAWDNSTLYAYVASDSVIKIGNVEKEGAVALKLNKVIEEGDTTMWGAADDLMAIQYRLTDRAAKRYVIYNDVINKFVLRNYGTLDNDTVKFMFRATAKADQYVLCTNAHFANSTDSMKVSVNSETGYMELASICNNDNNTFTLIQKEAPIYANITSKPAHFAISSYESDSKGLAMSATAVKFTSDAAGFLGAVKAEGQLKAEYAADDFSMWVDTACMEDVTKPLYYITTGIDSASTAKGIRYFLSTDSAKTSPYGELNLKKVGFVKSQIVNADSLKTLKADGKDAVKYNDINTNRSAFAFQIAVEEGENVYRLVSNQDDYLTVINNVLVAQPDETLAHLFTVATADAPTANEGVEVSSISVIAGQGNVQIAGAAGKKVVISNILGQVIANTVISSDNAVIAAPAGVVVVAVEGEEAVKAIVK